MKSIVHCCQDIRGMLEYYRRRKMNNIFKHQDGRSLTDTEARDYLYDCLGKGWKVIPLGECDNFDYQTGCNGHPCEEDKRLFFS